MVCQHCGLSFSDDLTACPSCHTPNPGSNPWAAAFPVEDADAQPRSSNPWVEFTGEGARGGEHADVYPRPSSAFRESEPFQPAAPVAPLRPSAVQEPTADRTEPVADTWGSVFGSLNSGVSEIDAILMKLHGTSVEAPVPDTGSLPPAVPFSIPDLAPIPASEPVPVPAPDPEPAGQEPQGEPGQELGFHPLPEIQLVVPVVPETPLTLTEAPSPWSPETVPMPDSIFRAPESVPVGIGADPDEEPAISDDSGVIDDDRTPPDLTRQSATRDRKTLTIVVTLLIIMAAIVAIALLIIFL